MANGDNKEFAIPNVSDGDVTVYVLTGGTTSASDTATEKYMNTNKSRTSFALRTDKVVHIVRIGTITMTDPITVPANGSHVEKELADNRFMASFDRIIIRPTQDNTNVKLRVRGGSLV